MRQRPKTVFHECAPFPLLEIPAGETVTFERGGKHLMLMRPTVLCDTVSLSFMDGNNLILAVDATFDSQTD